MFKKMIVCFMMIITLMLIGCANSEQKFLEYQNQGFKTRASVDINGEKYSVIINKSAENKSSITFEEPTRLKDTAFEIEGDSLFYCVGGLRLPLNNVNNNKIASLLHLFELSKDNIVSTETSLLNGVKINIINFKQESGNVTLYLATETDIPLRIEADIGSNSITANFSEFEVMEFEVM